MDRSYTILNTIEAFLETHPENEDLNILMTNPVWTNDEHEIKIQIGNDSYLVSVRQLLTTPKVFEV